MSDEQKQEEEQEENGNKPDEEMMKVFSEMSQHISAELAKSLVHHMDKTMALYTDTEEEDQAQRLAIISIHFGIMTVLTTISRDMGVPAEDFIKRTKDIMKRTGYVPLPPALQALVSALGHDHPLVSLITKMGPENVAVFSPEMPEEQPDPAKKEMYEDCGCERCRAKLAILERAEAEEKPEEDMAANPSKLIDDMVGGAS